MRGIQAYKPLKRGPGMNGRGLYAMEKELEERYGLAFAQEIRDRLNALHERAYFIRKIEGLAQVSARARGRVRGALRSYRTWKVEWTLARGEAGALAGYLEAEGQALRRFLEDTIRLYRAVSRDYHALQRTNPERLFRAESPSERAAAA